jgi:hypothetical protein
MKTATLLFSLALFTAMPSCIAQSPPKAPPKEPFVVAAGELSLTDLIDRSAAYLDCNILVSPQELSSQNAQPVRLQKGISTDRDGCEEFLANMLYRNGLALTRMDEKGSMLEVIGLFGPRGREVASRALECSPEAVLQRPNLKLAVTTVVPLEHVNATIATNALRPFFASTGQPGASTLTIGNVGSSKAMLISGMQDQVAQAIRLLRKCDVPGGMDGMGMPGMVDERVPALERRVKALEDALGKQKTAGDSKPK